MTKLTDEQLYAIVEPEIGLKGHYCKHKASETMYIITDVMLREVDLSIEISYRRMRKNAVTFSRPLGAFKERLEILGHWADEAED